MNNADNHLYCRRPTFHEFSLFLGLIQPTQFGKWTIIEYNALSVNKHLFYLSKIWGLLIIEPVQNKTLDIVKNIAEFGFNISQFDEIAPQGIIPSIPIDFTTWVKSAISSIVSLISNYDKTEKERVLLICKHSFWTEHVNILYKELEIPIFNDTDTKTISELKQKGEQICSDYQYLLHAKSDADFYIKTSSKHMDSLLQEQFMLYSKDEILYLGDNYKESIKSITISPSIEDSTYCDLFIMKKVDSMEFQVCGYRVTSSFFPINVKISFPPLLETPTFLFDNNVDVKKIAHDEFIKSNNRIIEILVLIDATIDDLYLKESLNQLSQIFSIIEKNCPDSHFALVAFGDLKMPDYPSQPEFTTKDITKNFVTYNQWKQVSENLKKIDAVDFLTALNEGMNIALHYNWKKISEKYIISVGYNPPHPYKWPEDKLYSLTKKVESEYNLEKIQNALNNKNIKQISVLACEKNELFSNRRKSILEKGKLVWKEIGRDYFVDNIQNIKSTLSYIINNDNCVNPINEKYIIPVIQ